MDEEASSYGLIFRISREIAARLFFPLVPKTLVISSSAPAEREIFMVFHQIPSISANPNRG